MELPKAPPKSDHVYPDKSDFGKPLDVAPTLHSRYQVVIPCFDNDQVESVAKQVSKFCGGYKECFVGVVSDGEIRGEVVVLREGFGLDAHVAAED